VADVEGLSPIEIVALATIAANAGGPDDFVATWSIRQDMEKAGYTRVATTLGLGSVLRKGMATSELRLNERDGEYTAYRITARGFDWLVKNQQRLVLRRVEGPIESPLTDDDIPFPF
jgi:hypothetical protein